MQKWAEFQSMRRIKEISSFLSHLYEYLRLGDLNIFIRMEEENAANQIRLLLDCGWDDRLDVTMLLPVLKYIPTLTAVLVSHPDFMHMGGLPYVFKGQDHEVPIFINADAFDFD